MKITNIDPKADYWAREAMANCLGEDEKLPVHEVVEARFTLPNKTVVATLMMSDGQEAVIEASKWGSAIDDWRLRYLSLPGGSLYWRNKRLAARKNEAYELRQGLLAVG